MFQRRDLTVGRIFKSSKQENGFFHNIQLFNYSRDALRLILEKQNLTSEYEILVPQVMCNTVINVISEFTERIIFYKITENFEIDEENITTSITARTKLVIFVDYFGIHRPPSRKLMDFLKSKSLIIVHDAAHGFLNFVHKKGVFEVDYDFTLVSVYKNVPWHIGAFLVGKSDGVSTISLVGYIRRLLINNIKTILLSTIYMQSYSSNAVQVKVSDLKKEKPRGGSFLVNWYMSNLKRHSFEREIELRKNLALELFDLCDHQPHVKNILTRKEAENSILMCYPLVAGSVADRDKLITKLLNFGVDAHTWPTYSVKNYPYACNETLVLIPFSENISKKVNLCLTI